MYNDASKDDPDPPVAYAEFDRFLSKQDTEHLKEMALEIKGQYIEAQDNSAFYNYIQSQSPAAEFVTDYSVRWIFLLLAGLLILSTYIPDIYNNRFRFRRIKS